MQPGNGTLQTKQIKLEQMQTIKKRKKKLKLNNLHSRRNMTIAQPNLQLKVRRQWSALLCLFYYYSFVAFRMNWCALGVSRTQYELSGVERGWHGMNRTIDGNERNDETKMNVWRVTSTRIQTANRRIVALVFHYPIISQTKLMNNCHFEIVLYARAIRKQFISKSKNWKTVRRRPMAAQVSA